MAEDVNPRRLEEPLAALERQLIDDYLRASGHDPNVLRDQRDEASRKLLTEAALHAAVKLTEVECRSHYLRKLHGEE